MHPGVVVLGGESLEAALDQAAVVGGEVHLVEEVAAVARVDEDRPGPAGDLQVAPDPLGGGPARAFSSLVAEMSPVRGLPVVLRTAWGRCPSIAGSGG